MRQHFWTHLAFYAPPKITFQPGTFSALDPVIVYALTRLELFTLPAPNVIGGILRAGSDREPEPVDGPQQTVVRTSSVS